MITDSNIPILKSKEQQEAVLVQESLLKQAHTQWLQQSHTIGVLDVLRAHRTKIIDNIKVTANNGIDPDIQTRNAVNLAVQLATIDKIINIIINDFVAIKLQ